jgi:hypothetical protein
MFIFLSTKVGNKWHVIAASGSQTHIFSVLDTLPMCRAITQEAIKMHKFFGIQGCH